MKKRSSSGEITSRGSVALEMVEAISWVVGHPPPADRPQRFDKLLTRTYGDVGIVTGMVIAHQPLCRWRWSEVADVTSRG